MNSVSAVNGSTAASDPQAFVVPSPCTAIHMIAFARRDEARAREFVEEMEQYANQLRPGIARTTIATTRYEFSQALRAVTALMLVSVHGPGSEFSEPVLGDGTPDNRLYLRHLSQRPGFLLGARAGIIWDACYAGQLTFLRELASLSEPGVVHIAPLKEIKLENSKPLTIEMLNALLAPGSPTITHTSVAAAAKAAAPSAGIKLWNGPLPGNGAS
jgi:hypothetical protein